MYLLNPLKLRYGWEFGSIVEVRHFFVVGRVVFHEEVYFNKAFFF